MAKGKAKQARPAGKRSSRGLDRFEHQYTLEELYLSAIIIMTNRPVPKGANVKQLYDAAMFRIMKVTGDGTPEMPKSPNDIMALFASARRSAARGKETVLLSGLNDGGDVALNPADIIGQAGATIQTAGAGGGFGDGASLNIGLAGPELSIPLGNAKPNTPKPNIGLFGQDKTDYNPNYTWWDDVKDGLGQFNWGRN